jgi:hypothetical protein
VSLGWERLADGVFRCRLPFLDVTVGLGTTATLARVLEEGEDAVFVPGHGAVVDAAFVRRQQQWLLSRL